MTEQLVEVAGRELWTARRGSGEALLLLPGMMSHHRYWRPGFRAALERSHELIELDHRGTGASQAAREPFAIADLAVDAAAVLDTLGVQRASVFGFSMGGAVALELALRRPELVERLVLAAPAVAGDGTPLHTETITQVLQALRSGDLGRSLEVAWRANVSTAFADDASGWADWTEAAGAYRMSLRTIEHQLTAIDEYVPAAGLEALEAPTLVVHGAEDRLVELQRSRALAEQLPHVQFHAIEGAGHLLFWERPTETARLVAEWIAAPGVHVGRDG